MYTKSELLQKSRSELVFILLDLENYCEIADLHQWLRHPEESSVEALTNEILICQNEKLDEGRIAEVESKYLYD